MNSDDKGRMRDYAAALRKKYGFRNAKSLGQNFLNDDSVIDAMVEGSDVGPDDLIIEIGPGMGVLTAAAADEAAWVTAVEIDDRLIPMLREILAGYSNIDIVNQDIMKTDLTELIDERRKYLGPEGRVRVMGNLPYYITTPILMKLLEGRVPAESFTIMMQKEVAERIEAAPGNRTYGALTVAVNYYCTVRHIADVPRDRFVPVPKVDSAVIRLDRRKGPAVNIKSEKVFFETVKAGFGKRRKTLSNAITGMEGLMKAEAGAVLTAAGIDPKRRAETLSLDEFGSLADAVVEYKGL